MARKLRIGFDQGPYELVAQTGKYGILHPRATFSAGGAPTVLRRYAAGHYIAWPTPLGAAGIPNGGTVSGTYPNATVTGGGPSNAGPAVRSSTNGQTGNLVTAGFVIRHNWSEINPTGSTYSYTRCDQQLAQARALGMPVTFMIVVRTFDGTTAPGGTNPATNPLPADLQAPFTGAPYGYADSFSTGASGSTRYGFQVWRWSPTIRSRYFTLCQKLGARYNGDIYFGGVATQETASGTPTGGSATLYTVNGYTGQDAYTSQGFLDGLNDENDSISTQCPNARGFPYQNFMQGPFPSGQTAQSMLLQYGTHVQPNGSWFGCPDLVTGTSGNSNIVNNVYPNIQKFHLGTSPIPNPGPTFAAVQNGEWNGTGVGDTPPNIANLFNYATSSFSCTPANGYTGALDWTTGSPLKCDAIMWDYEIGVGTPNFTTNLVPIMKAFPTFGTYVPAGSSAAFDYYISPTGSNSNNGTSTATPWAITALNTKRATYTGKTVGLMDGTYNMFATLNDGSHNDQDTWALDVDGGTAPAPTIIKAVNPRLAIITGKSGTTYGNANGTPMLGHSGQTTHRGYVTFDGLVITGVPRHGIRINTTGSTPLVAGITVKNCEFTDFNGIRMAGLGVNLSQMEFNNCTGHLIQNNYFHDNVGTAVGSSDHFTSTQQWMSNNGTYEYNTVERSGAIYGKEDGQFGQTIQFNYLDVSYFTDAVTAAGIADFSGWNGSTATTTSVHHNILIGAKGWDARDTQDNAEYSRDLVLFYNNTCDIKNSAASEGFLIKATAGNGSIYNNIVSDAASGDHFGPAYNIGINGIADYNCYFSSISSLRLATYASAAGATRSFYTTIAAFRTATGAEAHSITTNPSFIGTGSRAAKYHLNGGGCVGTGRTDGSSGGSAVDMGAWGNSPPSRIGCDFAQ